MSTPFPSTVPLRSPTTRTLTVPTDVIEFLDGSEQRWRAGLPLNALSLAFSDLPASQLPAMRTFIDTVKGAFQSNVSVTWADGNSYTSMGLDQDSLPAKAEKSNTRWSFSVKLRQVLSTGSYMTTAATSTTSATVGTGSFTFTTQTGLAYAAGWGVVFTETSNPANTMSGTVTSYSGTTLVVSVTATTGSGTHADWSISCSSGIYPKLPNNCITQRPYTVDERYLTTRNDLPSGPRYTWAEWLVTGGGLPGGTPPSHGLFTVAYPVITLAEITGVLNFFIAMGGKYTAFSFTEPATAVAHPHCRFDADAIEVKYVGGSQWSTSLPIAEFYHA